MRAIPCVCGKTPFLEKATNLEGTRNTTWWRVECESCGDKGAPWRRSDIVASGEWESTFHRLGPKHSATPA